MPKLKTPGIIKVFFSSPFGGMEEEREELTRRYFPQIRHLCGSHGLQFAAVDMRWGITSESSENAQVINICLQEIDRSDMFIGFFGQRYGWQGAEDNILQDNFNNAVGHYTWLQQYRDKSVTELEFLHGFLNDPGYLPAAIFFRDKSYDDKLREEGQKKGDKKQVFKYSAESDNSVKLMDDLKSRVSQQKDKSLGVFMEYKTPAEAAKIMFEIIMKYLRDTLLADLETQRTTKREETLSQHDAFLTSRCSVFVNRDKYLKALRGEPMQSSYEKILVTGEPGSGKSTALCNWIASLKQDKSSYAVAYHFVGFAENSTDINHILKRLVEEFEYSLYQDNKPVQEEAAKPEEGSIEETKYLMHKLKSVMKKIVSDKGKTPVVVIDGLDKVSGSSKIGKVLYWLPTDFPMGCIIALSTLNSDLANIKELNSRDYRTIDVEPLPETAKRDLCVQILQESGKELSPGQLDRIVAAEMTKLPIFLRVVLSELVSFGYFRLLDKKIDDLISSHSTEELFSKVLSRLEEDYNVPEYPDNLVEQVMCCIYLSRQGLKELEIKEIFDIPDQVWSPLFFAIEKLTINQSGCIKFGFHELKDACSMKYLSDFKKAEYLKRLINFFNKEINEVEDFNEAEEICPRPVLELPFIWSELGDMEGLADCLSNFYVFVNLLRHNQYDLVSLWQQTGCTGHKITDKLLLTFDKAISVLYTKAEKNGTLDTSFPPGLKIDWFLKDIDTFISLAGFDDCQEKVIQKNIRLKTELLELPKCESRRREINLSLRALKYDLACLYSQTDKKADEGIQLHMELLDIYNRQEDEHGSSDDLLGNISSSYHGIGIAYDTMRNFEKMIEYNEKAAECYEKMGSVGLSKFASTWNNLGLGLMGSGKLEQALEYFDKSIKAYEEEHFGEIPPIIGMIITNKAMCYSRLMKLEEAEEMYKKSLEIKEIAFGTEHQIVAMSYINLGTLEMRRENYGKSKEYNEKAREIYEALDQTWSNLNYVNCWENILACMTCLHQFEEADELIMKLLKWRLDDGSMDRSIISVYREMLVYYVREKVHYDRAFTMATSLLPGVFKNDLQVYIYLDMAVQNLPEQYAKDVPEEMTMKHVVECNPDRIDILGYYVQNYLVPAGDLDQLALCINRLHDANDEVKKGGYVHTLQWCSLDTALHMQCQQRILEEGLKRYPGDVEMCLSMAKCFRRQNRADLALPYALQAAEQQMDNYGLVLFSAQTAALAANYDTCRHYASHIIEKCSDDKIKSTAQEFMDLLDRQAESEKKEEDNNRSEDNTN